MSNITDSLDCAGLHIHAVEIVKNAELLLRDCPDGDIRYPVYSVTKSVTSAAFSLACDDGLVTADMPLAELLDSSLVPLMPESFRSLPFSRFLTMTAGIYPFRPEGDSWLTHCISISPAQPDSGFHYSNIPAYFVGTALENAVGGSLMDYLDRRLVQPLCIPKPKFRTCPQGHFYGATGMELSVGELSLLGQLYLHNGSWQSRQLISEAAVREAVTPRISTGSGDSYGYFFRVADDHVSMVRKWGQRCMVYPEAGLVIAYLSHQPERSDELYAFMRGVARDVISGNNPR